MKKIILDLTELRLLTETMLALAPQQEEVNEENKEDEENVALPEKPDPLLDKIFEQARAQIEQDRYGLEFSEEEKEKIQSLLFDALGLISEEGDLLLIGQLGEILSKFAD